MNKHRRRILPPQSGKIDLRDSKGYNIGHGLDQSAVFPPAYKNLGEHFHGQVTVTGRRGVR